MKKNCWEFKSCGNGEHCPAFREKGLDGVNSGKRAGRACWVVAGTLCGGEVHGEFAQKIDDCEECEFYQLVLKEERDSYVSAINLLSHLN